jgi:hypothetical protein
MPGSIYRTSPFGPAIPPRIASGGFGLFASGTGTVSFDQVRFTQYPDPALSLGAVLPRLGTSNVAWNAVEPDGTSCDVEVGIDGINFVPATNGGPIPGLSGQADPVIDLWTSDTSANYTNTSKSGGSAPTVTYDTANSRITLVGGSGGLYLYNAITDDDIDVIVDMDRSDAGGLTWRNQGDGLNFYELGAYDDSASGGFTNQLRLYKIASGTRSLLGTASTISWARSTLGASPYKRIRVTMLGAVISIYFDGTLMQTYTDGSPLAAGKVGLRNDGGTSRYYQLRVQVQGDYVSGLPAGDVVTGRFVYTQTTQTTTDPSVSSQLLDITTSARSPKVATGALIPQLHDPSKPFAAFCGTEMNTLAKASGDFYWDDKDFELTFKGRNATPAPFCLYSSDLLYKPQLQPTNASDLYGNQVIVTNTVGITDTQHEEKVADGSASSWNMAYPLYSAPSVSVGGVDKTVGVQGVDTGRDLYWQYGSVSIGQDSGAAKLPQGYLLEFTYIGQFPDQVVRNNLPEQAARKEVEGGSGIVAIIVDGQGMLSSNAIVYADGLLARRGNNDTTEVIMTTLRSGLESGMLVPTFIPEHHLNNRQLLIVKVSTIGYQQSGGNTLYEYIIDATDGPNLNNWSDVLFD